MSHLPPQIKFCQWPGDSHGPSSQGNHGKVNCGFHACTNLSDLTCLLCRVPNAVDGHDSPELEIYGMDGVPSEDLQRHYDGLPLLPNTKSKLIIGDSSILPILAAQKASVAMQLAESKNMTVQGDIGGAGGVGVVPAAPVVPMLSGSSAMSVVSPPLPSLSGAANGSGPVSPPTQPFWPYNYYQQASSGTDAYNQSQYAAVYAQYYQAYFAQSQGQAGNPYGAAGSNYASYYGQTQPPTASAEASDAGNTEAFSSVSAVPDDPFSSHEPLVIPPHVDPSTNKPIPGTIFTVPSLDRSLEELRSELKKYKNKSK